ncbi:MAG: hypothetical protein KGN02_08265 [bacterium]|nr:hypothetical protein [bacterium]
MYAVRFVLAIAMVVVGAVIIVRMFPYPIKSTFTALVLGAAMIALGAFRLLQLVRARQAR